MKMQGGERRDRTKFTRPASSQSALSNQMQMPLNSSTTKLRIKTQIEPCLAVGTQEIDQTNRAKKSQLMKRQDNHYSSLLWEELQETNLDLILSMSQKLQAFICMTSQKLKNRRWRRSKRLYKIKINRKRKLFLHKIEQTDWLRR